MITGPRTGGGGVRNRTLHYVDTRLADLRAYHDAQTQALEAEVDRRVRSLQETAAASAADIARRLEAMNEIRGALSDVLARAVTREMYDTGHEALAKRLEALIETSASRLDRLEALMDRQRGRQTAFAAISGVAGVIVTIFIIVAGHIHIS